MLSRKIIAVLLFILVLCSCNKENEEPVSCDKTVAVIAGNFKLVKVAQYYPYPLVDQDVTDLMLTVCGKTGLYELLQDKTAIYTESGSCGGSQSGNWDAVDGKISIAIPGAPVFTNLPIASWDCKTLVIQQEQNAGAGYKFYFLKQ